MYAYNDERIWFPTLEQVITGDTSIQIHATKKQAQQYAKSVGWPISSVFRYKRRFEHVWIVGEQDFQNNISAGIEFEILRIPTGQYKNELGTPRQEILILRRPIFN